MKEGKIRKTPPKNDAEYEKRLVSLAMEQAERKLMDGTASNQLIIHYLKLASPREKLERENLKESNKLLRAKARAIESSERLEEQLAQAMEAFTRYTGQSDDSNISEDDEY